MRRLLFTITLLISFTSLFAASPNFKSLTLYSKKGETYDFYPDKDNLVVYHSKGMPESRRGTYSFKSGGMASVLENAENTTDFNMEIYIGERTVKFTGKVTYNYTTGEIKQIRLSNDSVLTP